MTRIYGRSGEDGKKIAYPLLEAAVRLCWGWDALPEITRSEGGKPGFSGVEGHWFSISHSGGLALCALSDGGAVGVDVERVRPRREGLPRYALSDEEFARFDGSWEDFCRMWTLKESWCKREDIPLYPPRRLEMPPPCPHASYAGDGWRAAVCCTDRPPEEILWI